MPTLADLVALVREFGPIVGIVLLLLWLQAQQSAKLLDGLLDGLREVREAQSDTAAQQAAAVVELKGIRSDLSRSEAQIERLAERSTEHGETIRVHGAKIAEHARRIERLEGALPPDGVPTIPRRIVRPADRD